jgi:hypothetical protein
MWFGGLTRFFVGENRKVQAVEIVRIRLFARLSWVSRGLWLVEEEQQQRQERCGWEEILVEKRVSPLRAARKSASSSGRNDDFVVGLESTGNCKSNDRSRSLRDDNKKGNGKSNDEIQGSSLRSGRRKT